MKKVLLITLSLVLLISLPSCMNSKVTKVDLESGSIYYEYDGEIITVTNYHPYKFWSLPDYQEMIQYGDGAGLENEGVVYFIYVVDTSVDSDDPKAYYSAEFDGETKELLCEDGEYFTDEAEKNAAVERLFNLIDNIGCK